MTVTILNEIHQLGLTFYAAGSLVDPDKIMDQDVLSPHNWEDSLDDAYDAWKPGEQVKTNAEIICAKPRWLSDGAEYCMAFLEYECDNTSWDDVFDGTDFSKVIEAAREEIKRFLKDNEGFSSDDNYCTVTVLFEIKMEDSGYMDEYENDFSFSVKILGVMPMHTLADLAKAQLEKTF